MKGQFFIIATVVIIAAMILLMQYLLDFGASDLTVVEQFRESEYVPQIKQGFIQGINNSLESGDCDKLAPDLIDMESNFKRELISKGISFNADFNTTSCPTDITVEFNLTTNRFLSKTSFSYP
ncbi:MAG: hypothetical protein GOV02_03915 [Candidatus Aenigmarchaeota archaeon]|nr:hypothetical protein [Candidatus Aenigmarchaeota archaeon]